MSTFGFLYIRGEKQDYIFAASDTVCVSKFDDKMEKYHSLGSKGLYIPHVRTLFNIGGSHWLSIVTHKFIDNARALKGFDDVAFAIKECFHNYYKTEAENMDFCDSNNPNFIGSIMISGPSYYQDIFWSDEKRNKPLLMTRKFMVYKDTVKDCGYINPEIDDYNGDICEAVHPQLPADFMKTVADESQEIMSKNLYTGSLYTLKRWFIESNRIYLESGRKTMVTAGEVHVTVLELHAGPNGEMNFTCSQMVIHKFDDFDDVVKEITSKNE